MNFTKSLSKMEGIINITKNLKNENTISWNFNINWNKLM